MINDFFAFISKEKPLGMPIHPPELTEAGPGNVHQLKTDESVFQLAFVDKVFALR